MHRWSTCSFLHVPTSLATHASVFDLVFMTGCVTGVFINRTLYSFLSSFFACLKSRLSSNAYKVYLFQHAKTSACECVLAFFLFSVLQLGDWVYEKMLMARDSSRDETQKLHKKWLKHQAFMAELAQNKEWLDKIEKVSVEWVFSPILIIFYISSFWSISRSRKPLKCV